MISQAIGNQTVASVAATAAVVAALQPSRLWLQRDVRRMVYGEGADPTAVVARMGSTLGRAAESEDELLDSVTETLGRTLRLESVTLVGADSQVRARWGGATSEPEQLALAHHGRPIGRLAITTPPGEVLDGRGRAGLEQLLEVVSAALALAESAADLQAIRTATHHGSAARAPGHPPRAARRTGALVGRTAARSAGSAELVASDPTRRRRC